MTDVLRISRTLALPLDVVTEALGIVATRGAGKSYTSAVLIEEAYRNRVQVVVLDPSGAYWGLRSTADGENDGLAVYVLGGEHGDLPLDGAAGGFLADVAVESGHSFVFDLSDLSKSKARSFVADFLERLYERKARHRENLLLVIDEADEFAPQLQRSKGGDAPRCLGAVETVTKRGRRRGIGVVLITQRTQALNKDVLDLIETLIAMRQLAERSRDAVKGWIADKDLRDEAGVIESLQSLPTGEAWIWSPLRGILERAKIRRIRTFDSYRTPKPGEQAVEPAARAELDLDALGERMKTTVERAKENDPAELRRRLAAAERLTREQTEEIDRLARAEASRVERVEVPVARVEDLDEAWKLVVEAKETGDRLVAGIADVVRPLAAITAAVEAYNAEREEPPRSSPVPVEPMPPPKVAAIAPETNGDVPKLGKGERKVLDVLAQYPDGKTMNEVAFLTGYSARASTIAARISNLRKLGYVEPTQPVRLTPEGFAAAGGARSFPTGKALLDYWLNHPRVGDGERRVLLALIDAYPEAISMDDLATATGYSSQASTIAARLSNLRKLGLVEKTARRVSPEFYEAIRAI